MIPIVMLLPSLRKSRQTLSSDHDSDNINIARQRLADLENYNDEQIAKSAEKELQATLLEDLKSPQQTTVNAVSLKWKLFVVALIPVISIGLYSFLGSPQYINQSTQRASSSELASIEDLDINQLLEQLEVKISENPNNPTGWEIAAKTYLKLQSFDKAEVAYEKLNTLVPGNPDFLAGWADATIMKNQGKYTVDARQRIEKALKISPDHINSLWISSLGSESLGKYDLALTQLQNLLKQLEGDNEATEQIEIMIARNRELAGNQSNIKSELAIEQRIISVKVDLDISLADNIDDNDVLYIFAKAQNGPPMPLAVSKHSANKFPVTTTLSSKKAMMENFTIDHFENLEISARISKSGDAIEHPGDLTSDTIVVRPTDGEESLLLIINQRTE